MKRKRFTPQQISSILGEYDNGKSVEEISRDHDVEHPLKLEANRIFYCR